MNKSNDVFIVAPTRTPLGGFQGALRTLTAPQLGSLAVKPLLQQTRIDPSVIEEVLFGCVLPAGLGQSPARQVALGAGLPESVSTTTLNKVCGSGMKAAMLAHDQIKAGSNAIIIAGGMESMTNAPYMLPKAREGYRLGHNEVIDHMFFDGLQDAGSGGLMGAFAQDTADDYKLDRKQMDAYALESLQRAKTAIEQGYFKDEIVPITLSGKKGDTIVDCDEQPGLARPEKIPQLKPAFKKDGTVTAANASSISDGAAAMLIANAASVEKYQLTPMAKIIAHSSHGQSPSTFCTAPIGAIRKVLKKADWSVDDVDLFEINEAFAVVPLTAMQELGIDSSKVNVNGGACALGHPLGASGARIIVTLIHALKRLGKSRGLASLCIGGGEATAVAIELV